MKNSLLSPHRKEILAAAARHGATNVRVFGSMARGDQALESDLDLLVSFESGRSLLDLVALKLDIEDLIERPVDVVSDRALSHYIRDRVLSEATPL